MIHLHTLHTRHAQCDILYHLDDYHGRKKGTQQIIYWLLNAVVLTECMSHSSLTKASNVTINNFKGMGKISPILKKKTKNIGKPY